MAFAVAGCGGTGLDLGSGGGDPPPGGYEKAGNTICAEVAQRFAEAQAAEPRTFAQGGEVVATLIDIAEEGESQLASLEPPKDLALAFNQYLKARGEVVALLERAEAAAEAEDGAAYERARRDALDGAGKRGDLAREAGLQGCARVEGR